MGVYHALVSKTPPLCRNIIVIGVDIILSLPPKYVGVPSQGCQLLAHIGVSAQMKPSAAA